MYQVTDVLSDARKLTCQRWYVWQNVVMAHFIVRASQERFFVVEATSEQNALQVLIESVIAEFVEVEIQPCEWKKFILDSRDFARESFKPNWKWDGRGVFRIKNQAAKA